MYKMCFLSGRKQFKLGLYAACGSREVEYMGITASAKDNTSQSSLLLSLSSA